MKTNFMHPLSSVYFVNQPLRTKTLINIRQHNYFIIRGYMFRLLKRSSSGLLTD